MSEEIDISKDNVLGLCDYKCSYNYNYSNSNVTAKNNGTSITLTIDNDTSTPVVYNKDNYSVFQINIFAPSLHLYEGKKQDAEIIIRHSPQLGGSFLFVCIPINQTSEASMGGDLIENVINAVSSSAPDKGESATLNINDFTLQSVVPAKPFVTYEGVFGGSDTKFVVFTRQSFVPISKTSLKTLKDIIKPFNHVMHGGNMYLNSKGPNSTLKRQGIYIDCNPTGSYGETTTTTTSESTVSQDDIKTVVKYVIIFVTVLAAFLLMNYFFSTFLNKNKA